MQELVSVIMPYYKKKDFFYKSFLSVISQSYKKIEIIIIYDQNNLDEYNYIINIIKNYKNKKITLHKNKKNKGVSYSRNLAIKKSKGKFIAFLDCDDVWHPKKIQKQLLFMKKEKINISFTSYKIINSKNEVVGLRAAKKEMTYQNLLNSCDIGLSTVIIKKKILSKNPFPIISTKEDYVLWLHLSKKYKILGLRLYLTSWRKVRGSLSGNFLLKIKNAFIVYNKYEKFNFFSAVFRVLILSINFLKK